MKKKTISLIAMMLVLVSLTAVPAMTASAASYPVMYSLIPETTIVEGTVGTLEFAVMPKYHNEQYHVFVYDKNDKLLATVESTYYNSDGSSSVKDISISVNTSKLGMKAGEYKVVYYLSFYTMYEWHDAPKKYTSMLTVVSKVCGGNHQYNEGIVYAKGDCYTKEWRTYTCKKCGFIKRAEGDYGHQWNKGKVIKKPTAGHQGSKKCTCKNCGTVEIVDIPAIFCDVSPKAYYEKAITWAYNQKITSGTTSTTYAPEDACTRGQIVTFLWRASGSPSPKSSKHPFTDIKKSDYYYKAVLWAVEEGITTGYTPTKFAPAEPCTRGQIVTFLWRAGESQKTTTAKNPFSDVKKSDYYYKAVLWAVDEGITSGTTKNTFAPKEACTRGQIATFLYRYYN